MPKNPELAAVLTTLKELGVVDTSPPLPKVTQKALGYVGDAVEYLESRPSLTLIQKQACKDLRSVLHRLQEQPPPRGRQYKHEPTAKPELRRVRKNQPAGRQLPPQDKDQERSR